MRPRLGWGIGELDHPRLFVAPGVDTEEPATTQLDEPGLVEDLHGQASCRPEVFRHLRHAPGREQCGWCVGQVAGEVRGLCHGLSLGGPASRRSRSPAVDDEGQVGHRGDRRLRLECVVPVSSHEDALYCRLAGVEGGEVPDGADVQGQAAVGLGHPGESGCGVPDRVRARCRLVADPDQDGKRPLGARDDRGLTGLALEAGGLQGPRLEPELGGSGSTFRHQIADRGGLVGAGTDRHRHRARQL